MNTVMITVFTGMKEKVIYKKYKMKVYDMTIQIMKVHESICENI